MEPKLIALPANESYRIHLMTVIPTDFKRMYVSTLVISIESFIVVHYCVSDHPKTAISVAALRDPWGCFLSSAP